MGEGTQRNQQCTCGCGKKLKKCPNGGRKPVQPSVTAKMHRPTRVTSYTVGPGGAFEILEDGIPQRPFRAWAEHTRPREGKSPKIVNRMPVEMLRPRTGDLSEFLRYKNIFSIDTNYKEIGDIVVAASAFGIAEVAEIGHGKLEFRGSNVGVFEFSGCEGNPERLGWNFLNDCIIASPDYDPKARYALVADAHLGLHDNINERAEPLFGSSFLADNIDLMYGSSDTGNDPLNIAVKDCDRIASVYFKAIESGGIDHSSAAEVVEGPCKKFRLHPTETIKLNNMFRLVLAPPSQLKIKA